MSINKRYVFEDVIIKIVSWFITELIKLLVGMTFYGRGPLKLDVRKN